jgi:hypothetical protein
MSLRSRYREKPETEKPNIQVTHEGTPADITTVTREIPRSENEVNEALNLQPETLPADPTLALKKQIDDLRKSEDVQRTLAQHQHQPQQLTAEQILQQTAYCAHQRATELGFQPNTPAHTTAAQRIFHAWLGTPESESATAHHPEPSAHHPEPPAEEKPAPFFAPSTPAEESHRASIISAPVSREAPSSGGYRRSSQVTLSREEKEYAKLSGVTEVEYAKQKQRLAEAKDAGLYGEKR